MKIKSVPNYLYTIYKQQMKGNLSFHFILSIGWFAIPSVFYGSVSLVFALFMSKSYINKNKSNKYLLL